MKPTYDEDDTPKGFQWGSAIVILLAISGLISLAWYAQETSRQEAHEGSEVPVIEAQDGPIKERPQNPGGKQFPNQDKQVYHIINSSDYESVPSVQLAEPAPKPVIPDEPKPDEALSRDEAVKKLKQQVESVKAPVAEIKKPEVVKPSVAPKPVTNIPAEPKPQPVVRSGSVALQLGAFRSAGEAQAHWNKVSKKFTGMLAGYRHSVQKADLGSKGIFYRLRLNGFESKPSANALCAKLKAQGQPCFIAK